MSQPSSTPKRKPKQATKKQLNVVKIGSGPTKPKSTTSKRIDPLTAFVNRGLPSSQGSATGSSKGKEKAGQQNSYGGEMEMWDFGSQADVAVDDRLWVEIYEPTNEAELAVHIKKVEDVRRWFKEAFEGGPSGKLTKYRRILALTGPAGTGKTATIRVLARELGFEIMEWRSSVAESTAGFQSSSQGDEANSWADQEVEYESLFTKFQTFLQRASSCQTLFPNPSTLQPTSTTASSSGASTSKGQKVILLEDLPNILHEQTQAQFHAVLESLARFPAMHPPAPIVIVVSDAGVRGEINSEERMGSGYGWGRDRDGAIDIRTVLPRTLLNGPYVTTISFNPIAPTLMKKALQAIINSHFMGRVGAPSKEMLDAVVESSNGDIRGALMALQFACITTITGGSSKSTGRKKKPGMSTAVLEAVTRREQSLALFHLLGKVLYNKRKGDPPGQSASAKEKKKEEDLDAMLTDPSKLPPHLQEHERRTSRVDVDVLYSDSPIDSSLFSLYIQQNYSQFCNELEECGNIAEWLSWIDSNGGEAWYQGNPHRFHLIAMGTLHSLPSPVIRRSQTVTKPDFFEVLSQEKRTWEDVRDVQAQLVEENLKENTWAAGGWNQREVTTELGGVLKALDTCGLNIGRAKAKISKGHQRHTQRFYNLPFSRGDQMSLSKTLSPDDVDERMTVDEEEGNAGLKVAENEDGGWLDSDDIEEF